MSSISTRVHGNAFSAENPVDGHLVQVDGRPYSDVDGVAQGGGRTYRLERDSWFHVPIPSISELNGSTLYLDTFFVLFTTQSDDHNFAAIDFVHAWDGSARIFIFQPPNVSYAGDWSNPRAVTNAEGFTFGNTWRPRRGGQRIAINTGLCVCLHGFGLGGVRPGNITFHSAGAAWVDRPA